MLLEKSMKVFSKPSGLKYAQYCQGYIHFLNRRHTKKIAPSPDKVLSLQKPEYESQINFRKSHQIS